MPARQVLLSAAAVFKKTYILNLIDDVLPLTSLKLYLSLCRPFAGRLFFGLLLILIGTFLAFPIPWILKFIIDEAIPKKNEIFLLEILSSYGIIVLVRALLNRSRNRLLQHTALQLASDLRIRLFAHLQALSVRYIDARLAGEVIARVTQDTTEVYNLTNSYLVSLIADAFTVPIILAFLAFLDMRLAIVIYTLLPLFLFNYLFHQRAMRDDSRIIRSHWDYILGFLHEKVSGTRTIKSFGREREEISAFALAIDNDKAGQLRLIHRSARLSCLTDLLGSLGVLAVLIYGSILVISGQLALGTLVAFSSYSGYIFPATLRFVDSTATFHRAAASLDNIVAFLETAPEIIDSISARPLSRFNGKIEFRGVGFNYESQTKVNSASNTLTDISFVIEPGQIAAIVGSSGAGKSTLVNLLARFYDPDSGEILVDDCPLREVQLRSFREQVGIVLQDAALFSGSIEDNIRYGRFDSLPKEIIEAATAANAHQFIAELPLGYKTLVGERGVRLSGGQRQRIAIARAVLRDPRLLIFDEATSAIDLASERLIQQAMRHIMKGRTTLIIAHRLSTIKLADLVLVMDSGKLVESGTHTELLSRNGTYTQLFCSPQAGDIF